MTDAVKTTEQLSPEEAAKAEAVRKREETRKKKEEAESRSDGLDSDQKDHLAAYLLKQSKERRLSVLEMVIETWASTLTDDGVKTATKQQKRKDYSRRLEWVRDYFGTSFEREGQPRFRTAKLSAVVGALVKFCLSAADRDKSQPADLGLFAETAEVKTGQALLDLSTEGEGVAITEEGYNQTQKLLRILLDEFGDKVFENEEMKGTKVGDYIREVRSKLSTAGSAGPILPDKKGVKTFTEQEKKHPERRAAYEGAKRMVYAAEAVRENTSKGANH
jgi:hypothetical protein